MPDMQSNKMTGTKWFLGFIIVAFIVGVSIALFQPRDKQPKHNNPIVHSWCEGDVRVFQFYNESFAAAYDPSTCNSHASTKNGEVSK